MRKPFWGILVFMLFLAVFLVSCGSAYSAEKKSCEAAFTAPVESGTSQSPVLMLMINEWSDDGWDQFTHPLIPAPEGSDAKTLVCIRQRRTETDDIYYLTIGGIQSSTPADVTPYQLTWDVRLVELPAGKVIASGEFQGGNPPHTVSVSDTDEQVDLYGDEPITALFQMLRPILTRPVFFTGHDIREIAFSPNGRFLASAGSFNLDLEDPFLMMWNVSSGEIAVVFDNPDQTYCLAFSPDGKALATCDGGKDYELRVWDTTSGQLLYKLPAEINKVAYSPDGKLLVAGGREDDLLVLDAASGAVIYRYPVDNVVSLAFSPDGKILAIGSNQPIQFLDPASGKEIDMFGPSGTWCLSFSPDGRQLAVNRGLWDIASRQIVQTFEDGLGCTFSPDGAQVAQSIFYGYIYLWDVATGEKAAVIEGFKEIGILGLAYSPDGKWLAIGSTDDGMIFLYDLAKVK